jgi:hypothetical protein
MIFYKFKISQTIILIIIMLLCFGYILIDQFFIPENLRPIAFIIISILALLIFFIIVKPDNSFQLSRTLSLILGIVDLIIIIIFHVIIIFNISYKNFIILGSGIIIPFLDGFLYNIFFKRRLF